MDILLAGEAREPLHRTIEQASEDHPKVIDFGVLSDDPEAILDEVFDLARSLNNKAEILIAGMANIHTEDAKRLMAALESPQSEYRGGSAHTDRKDAA